MAVASASLQVWAPNDPRWMHFIEGHPDATVFHHPAWAALLTETYGYRPLVLAQVAGDDTIAGIPMLEVRSWLTGRRFVSLPFSDYCPALGRDDEVLVDFTRALIEWQCSRAVAPVEIRGDLPALIGVRRMPFGVRHLLQLSPDQAHLLAGFDQPVRQRIKRAAREGLTSRISTEVSDLEAFYALHWQTRRRLGVPVQPRRFFEGLWRRIIATGLGFLVLVEKGGRAVAANVFLAWNGNLIGKYSASDHRYWRLGPNNLMLWTGIGWGCDAGFRLFDFGKSDLENLGLRAFKSSWGSTEVPLVYATVGDRAGHAPYGLASRVLAQVIRRSPPLVCRLSGQLLYGHFA
jgi:CelD/BcsL family acetyltransferase involved in cellulose biosynthesis